MTIDFNDATDLENHDNHIERHASYSEARYS